MKLLCIADMHLGRVPARLHEELDGRAAELGPAAAWRRAVDLALEEQVTAVLLAGDLVDGGNDFFEAFSDLRKGALRLTEAGVQVVAVAGNHDPEVLARLVQVVPQVRLLGAGGAWEVLDLPVPSQEGAFVRLVGWSFPSRWVSNSPLASPELAEALARAAETTAGRPRATIGLLHADRDQAGSRYAPVSSVQLAEAQLDAWLLGHVHVPDVAVGGSRGYSGGYLGSLSSNDPGETGARGAWLVRIAEGGAVEYRHERLAPMRWERLEVDVSDLAAPEDVQALLISSLEELGQDLVAEGASPVAVGCRLILSGRTPFRSEIEQILTETPPGARLIPIAGADFFVDEVRLEALPQLDLGQLAEQDDPVGLLAARIVALRSPGSELRDRLVTKAAPLMAELNGRSDHGGGFVPVPDEDAVAELLEEAALKALDALLSQSDSEGTRSGAR